MLAVLPLLIAAAPMATGAAPPPRVTRVATASVQIIKLKSVSVTPAATDAKLVDRQYRQRETMPLVEFF